MSGHVGDATPAAVLHDLCSDSALRARGTRLAAELRRIAGQLERPLQLVVAGEVSAGKSTLINALLGRPVAAADAGECTRRVTWYEHGPDDGRIVVEGPLGPLRELRLVDGRMPAELEAAVHGAVRLRVQLCDPLLRAVTLVDSPGVDTVTAGNEAATRRLLFGDVAAEHAQALLYVLRRVHSTDADLLGAFRALSVACGLTAVNTVAVLSQVDRVPDGDPWPTARRLAGRAAARLQGSVLDVAPVVGLLAETGRAGLLGPAELAGLRRLAELDPDEVDDAVLDLDEFGAERDDLGVPEQVRRSLVSRLHRYGLREAVGFLRAHPAHPDPLRALHEHLAARSGFGAAGADTRITVDGAVARFVRHADLFKAHAALVAIRAVARLPVHPGDADLVGRLLADVDESRPLAAGLAELRVLAACAALGSGQLHLDDAMTVELITMARGDDDATRLGLPPGSRPERVRGAAVVAAGRWRYLATMTAGTVAGQRARDVLTAVEEIADRALRGARPDAAAPGAGATPPALPELPDRAALAGLAASPRLDPAERAALAALLAAEDVCSAVGLRPGCTGAEVRAAASALAGRFRALLHLDRPADRRAARAACDFFESVVAGLPAPGPGGRP